MGRCWSARRNSSAAACPARWRRSGHRLCRRATRSPTVGCCRCRRTQAHRSRPAARCQREEHWPCLHRRAGRCDARADTPMSHGLAVRMGCSGQAGGSPPEFSGCRHEVSAGSGPVTGSSLPCDQRQKLSAAPSTPAASRSRSGSACAYLIEGHSGSGVTMSLGDSPNVDAGGDERRHGKMPQIMEPERPTVRRCEVFPRRLRVELADLCERRCLHLLAQPAKAVCERVGIGRDGTVGVIAQDEGVGNERRLGPARQVVYVGPSPSSCSPHHRNRTPQLY